MLAHFFVVRETLRLKKHFGLTVPQTCLLVDASLPRTGSPTDRAIANAAYRWAPTRPPAAPIPAPKEVLRVPVPAI